VIGIARAALAVLAVALAAGCAEMETSTWASNPQGDCERRGGVWRVSLGFCEYQGGSGGSAGM